MSQPFKGSSEVKVGRWGKNLAYFATIEPWHGHQVVVYAPTESDQRPRSHSALSHLPFGRQVIAEPLQWGHAVWCADLDGDSDDELIIGQRDPNKPGSVGPRGPGVFVFDPKPGAAPLTFDRHTIDDGGMACEDALAADLDGDGRADIIAGGRATHNVRIYWNRQAAIRSRRKASSEPSCKSPRRFGTLDSRMTQRSLSDAGFDWLVSVPWVRSSSCLAANRGLDPNQSREQPAPEIKTDAKINEPFKKPDVKRFIATFESDNREIYAKRHGDPVGARLDARHGGGRRRGGHRACSPGYSPKKSAQPEKFMPSKSLPSSSRTYRRRRSEAWQSPSRRRSWAARSRPTLPQESVDLVFLCDVYHHLEKPAKTLASIRRALKPGGRLVVIDFDRVEGRSTEFVLKHVRAGKSVFLKEIEAAGFRSIPTPQTTGLQRKLLPEF